MVLAGAEVITNPASQLSDDDIQFWKRMNEQIGATLGIDTTKFDEERLRDEFMLLDDDLDLQWDLEPADSTVIPFSEPGDLLDNNGVELDSDSEESEYDEFADDQDYDDGFRVQSYFLGEGGGV